MGRRPGKGSGNERLRWGNDMIGESLRSRTWQGGGEDEDEDEERLDNHVGGIYRRGDVGGMPVRVHRALDVDNQSGPCDLDLWGHQCRVRMRVGHHR